MYIFSAFDMDYESSKSDANLVEEGVLLIQPDDRDLWINLVIKESVVLLFDYHTGYLVKTISITEDFDHGNIMSPNMDIFIKSANQKLSDVHIKARDERQKLKIGFSLASAKGSKVHGFTDNPNDLQNEVMALYRTESDYSENASSIPDSPKHSPRTSMSVEDANAIIKRGTVTSLKMVLGNELTYKARTVGTKSRVDQKPVIEPSECNNESSYKPRGISNRPTVLEDLVPPDPPERGITEPEPDYIIESDPDYAASVQVTENIEEISEDIRKEDYATTMEVSKPWHMPGYPTRKEAEEMVKNKMNGTFIVRNRQGIDSTIFPYAVTMAYDNKPVHIQIQRTRDQGLVFAPYKAGEQSFNDLDELIVHYQDNKFYFAINKKQGYVSLRRYDE